MVSNIRLLEKALGSNKKLYNEEKDTVILQRRCLRAAKDIEKGTKITRNLIDVLRPAPKDSISPKYLDNIIEKVIDINVKKGDYFKFNNFKK